MSQHEHDEDYDVLVSFLESEQGIVEEALLVLEEFRRGRTRRWELGGNAHSLELSSESAEIVHEPWELRLRLTLDEFAGFVSEWTKFQREQTEIVRVTYQLVFNSVADAAGAEGRLEEAQFAVGRVDARDATNSLYAMAAVDAEEEADARLARALSGVEYQLVHKF